MQGLYIKPITWPRLESNNKKVITKQHLKEEQRLKRIYKKNSDLMKSLDQQIEEEEDLHEEPIAICCAN